MDFATLERLSATVGASFYLLDVPRFVHNAKAFKTALERIYPKVRLAHSYKTNHLPDLALEAHRLGHYAEVVSDSEYDVARRYGIPGSEILFNGPIKTREALAKAIGEGATVNADNLEELAEILDLAPAGTGIGLRVTFDLGNGGRSRFGLSVEDGDFARACAMVRDCGRVAVVGLHCHFSVPQRDAASFSFRTRRLLDLAEEQGLTAQLRFIDVGGGFASPMSEELKRQFDVTFPDYDEYAAAVAGEMAARFGNGVGPYLILEPGMGLMADTMKFVCRIHGLKSQSGGGWALTTGSIFNVKPFLHRKNVPFLRIPGGRPAAPGPWQVTGFTCMEIDVLHADHQGELASGDFLVFENCGAYASSLCPAFICPPPAIVRMDDGIARRIVRATGGADGLLSGFNLPTLFSNP